MNTEFWRGKKVLVTGHTGFKGGWLSIWLQQLGADVIGYSLPPLTTPSLFEVASVGESMVSIEADVRDLGSLVSSIEQYRPDIVIHMAAQALVHSAYADPVTTYSTNVIGTMNVLEAVRNTNSVKVIVSITSDKCYENREWVWGYRENDRMGGHDPYSSSKGCAELLISTYRDSYFNPKDIEKHGVVLASTRAGNVIGGGDWSADRLIPDIMKAIMENKSVLIRRPKTIRPWQFVLEPLRGYLELAEQAWMDGPKFAGAWNFGPNIEQIKPVDWIVENITKNWGGDAGWCLDNAEYPHEDHLLKLDCTKAKSLLNWTPKMDLALVLDWIVEWYKGFESGADMYALTLDQIKRYEKL